MSLCILNSSGLPWWLSGKESACNAGDTGSIPGLGRSPEGGNGNLHQYFCLENSMDRGAWWAIVQGISESKTQLSTHAEHNITVVSMNIRKNHDM